MSEKLLSFREPAAWVVEAIVILNMLWSVARVIMRGRTAGYLQEMGATGGTSLGIASLVLLILAVALCTLATPATPRAALVSRVGMITAYAGAALSLIFLVGGLIGTDTPSFLGVFEALGGLTDVAIKVLCGYVMMHMARALVAGHGTTHAAVEPSQSRTAPSWQPQDAVGVRWDRASDAARSAKVGAQPELPTVEVPALTSPVSGVQPVKAEAVEGPAAKADRSLWKRS